jgi:hypothetical protein
MEKFNPNSASAFQLTEQMFNMLATKYRIGLHHYETASKKIYMDGEEKLRYMLPHGSCLSLDFIGENLGQYQYLLKLIVADENRKKDIYTDILSKEAGEDFLENQGVLPNQDHSNVARKLLSLGIMRPFTFYAKMTYHVAQIHYPGNSDIRILLKKTEYNSMSNVSHSVICYSAVGTDAKKTESILQTFLFNSGITTVNPTESSMKRLFEHMDAVAVKK